MNVEITGLTRRFGSATAVAGVDLRAGPGVFGLLGPNGAGKTTLLRMMATAVPPTSGQLRLLGRDPAGYGPRREIRRRLGYLPQNPGYYPGFTVTEFVEYFALLKEVPAGTVRQAVATAIDRVGLADRRKHRLRTLSGGMLRRAVHRAGHRQRAGAAAVRRADGRPGPAAAGDVPCPAQGAGAARHRRGEHPPGRGRRRRVRRGRADGPGPDRLPGHAGRADRARRRAGRGGHAAGARVHRVALGQGRSAADPAVTRGCCARL